MLNWRIIIIALLSCLIITQTKAYDSVPILLNFYTNATYTYTARSVIAVGDMAYLVQGNYMVAINGSGTTMIQTNYTKDATKLNVANTGCAYGGYLYILSYTGKSVTTFNITGAANAKAPVLTGYYTNSTSLNVPLGCSSNGSYLYVTSRTGASITTLNISGSRAGTPVQTNYQTNANYGGGQEIVVYGNYVYMTAFTAKTLCTFDISTPVKAGAPSVVGCLTNATSLNEPFGISAVNNYLYVTSRADKSLITLDINGVNASSPIITDMHTELFKLSGASPVRCTTTYCYIASDLNNSLTVFNITGVNARTPTLTYTTGTNTTYFNNPSGASIYGDKLFITAYSGNGVSMLNITTLAGAGVDTCACPTTADWYIGGCTIATTCDVKGKAIYVNGTTTINYGVTVSNFTSIILTNVTTSIMKVLGVVKQK